MDMTRQLAMPKVLYAHIADVQKKSHTNIHKHTNAQNPVLNAWQS